HLAIWDGADRAANPRAGFDSAAWPWRLVTEAACINRSTMFVQRPGVLRRAVLFLHLRSRPLTARPDNGVCFRSTTCASDQPYPHTSRGPARARTPASGPVSGPSVAAKPSRRTRALAHPDP